MGGWVDLDKEIIMKKLLFVFGLLIFMGCEDDKAAAEDVNPLVGVWEATE